MFKKIIIKISAFSVLLFGLLSLSGCSQSSVGLAPKQTPTTSFSQPKPMHVQVNTMTRAS